MSVQWNWAGARWWRCDFHTHTPGSSDYGKGQDHETLKNRTPEQWLLDYMRAKVDCIAVTDHNTGAWIDKLKDSLKELEAQGHPEFRKLYLFPGVEITVNGGIHILAILPEDKTTAYIDSLLGAIEFRGTKGKSNDCTEESPVKVIEKIADAGGLAIPAHVDQERGLFQFTGTTLEQVLDSKHIIAMELCDLTKSKPQLYEDKKCAWAEILGSDAHHPTGEKSPGSHYTWVKMGKPSLEGLRLALLDGLLSIKRSDRYSDNPNEHGHLVIKDIQINEAKHIGRKSSFNCTFNPWLNAIIGGRGTGKSTLLEFIRLTLRRDKELPDTLKNDLIKYQQVYESRDDEGLLTKNTILVVTYLKDNAQFQIQWSYDGSVEPIRETNTQGHWQPGTGEITQRFPIRIYSQKQIFELAKQPQALLQVIDEAPEINFQQWKQQWNEVQNRFFSLRAQAREIEATLNEEPRLKGELDDIKRKLLIFENAGHANILKTYQHRQRQRRVIEKWEESWKDSGDRIRELSDIILPDDIDQSVFKVDQGIDTQCLSDIQNALDKLKDVSHKLKLISSELDQIFVSWKETKEKALWTQSINEALLDYERLRTELTDAGAGDPSEYGLFVRHRQSLEERLKAFNSRRENLDELNKQADESLEKLKILRKELIIRRSHFLESVLKNNLYVKIDLIPFGNKESVEGQFREIINRTQGGFERDIGSPDNKEGILGELYCRYCPEKDTHYEDFSQDLDKCKDSIQKICIGADSSVGDRRFTKYIQNLPPENFDRLDCWFPEDSLKVLYSADQGKKFKPVKQGSPGQKTAALLAFLLSYGKEPLILDQPEDDLDNHLIYELIVAQLREIKQKRQVIVVTHNANIVVNGDAENVIVLDVRESQTKIICQGSLQDKEIRNEICRIMEGGEEAFKLRYKRIGQGGRHV
jgi:ABC-type lipoprotein export system ATPase subunit